jgi:hypothetical protein
MSEKLVFELQAIDRATAPLRQVQTQLDRTTAAVRRTNSEYARAQAGTRNFGMMAGQVGFQVQDFAVQVANGTSAITAFGQQAPQALGMFGPKGALLGAIVAVGAAILGVSAKTSDLSFNFQRFAADIGPIMEPVRAVFGAIGRAFKFLGNLVIDTANLIINSLQYLAVFIGTLPAAFRAALDQIRMRFKAFEYDIQSAAMSARAVVQDLRDFLSGSEEPGFAGDLGMADSFRYAAESYKSQADAMRRLADDAKGFGGTISEAMKGVTEIDLRNYFESAGAAAEEAGGKAAAAIQDQMIPALENMQAIADSMREAIGGALMSMVDGTKSVKDSFRDMARTIVAKLYEVLVVQQIVNGVMGIVGKAFPALQPAISGARAMGGPVTGNRAYLVGEKGPEVIVPSRNSQVVPNNQIGSGGVTVVQNINISTGVQQTVRQEIRTLMPQIAESAKAAVIDARRRGGQMKAAFG